MSKKGPGMLEVILAAQKEKSGGEGPSLQSLEDALSGVNEISAADLKKLLAGGSIGAPASNVIDIAQDIKVIAENSNVETATNTEMADNIDKLVEHQEETAPTQEEKDESIDLVKEQNDLLSQIEENTREEGKTKPKKITDVVSQTSDTGGFLSGLLGFLGGGLVGGLLGGGATAGIGKLLFGGITGFIGKVFTSLIRGSIITMLVGSLANGLIDGIVEYQKSGDFKEALWAGFAGFLEFLTFGLIDKKVLDEIAERFKNDWNELTKNLRDFVEELLPEDMKKRKTETKHSTIEESGAIDRFDAATGNNAEGHGAVVSSYKTKDSSSVKIEGSEKMNKQGENLYTVKYDDREFNVSKQTYEGIKDALSKDNIEEAKSWLSSAIRDNEELGPQVIPQFQEMEVPTMGDTNVEIPERTLGDVVHDYNKKIKDFNFFDWEKSQIDKLRNMIITQTTNVNNQTTLTPQVRARDNEPALDKLYGR